MRFTCSRQEEVNGALINGHWPEACDPELHAHVEACCVCAEHILVTQTFQRAREETANAAKLAAPGTLWCRAQLHRRYSAVQRASKPIAIAQIFALVLTSIVAAGLIMSQWRYGAYWLSWFSDLSWASTFSWASANTLASLTSQATLLYLGSGCGVLAIISTVAVYLASERR